MLVITVARKPMSEGSVAANVLKHGTGALNINSARIAAPGEAVKTHSRSPEASKAENRPVYGEYGPQTTHQSEGQKLGRWPANLILQHKPGCRRVGTREVRSDGHFPASRPSGSQVSGPSGHSGQEGLTERHTNGETVTAWDCEPDCPVADLDEQSGVLQSGGRRGAVYGTHPESMGVYGDGLNHKTSPAISDKGGASRFFKQVGGREAGE